MNSPIRYILLLLCLNSAAYAQQTIKPVPVEAGVSLELAKYRHSSINNIQYKLDFSIPAEKATEITATEQISFNLQSNGQPLQIDFKQSPDNVKALMVNGKTVAAELKDEHIVINQQYLRTGANNISLEFIAGDASLNRNTDYLYALFVPDRARTVFPCFDQPDLKSRFLLTLTVPEGWKVLANGQQKDSLTKGSQITYHFNNSDPIPTYLFSFTAGKYSAITRTLGNRSMQFLYRETDTAKIRLSVDSVFKAHGDAISFLEGWTGIPYPFQKVGFVAIPDFQFGGMEHPGEVQYKASGLFLDDGATKDQFIARSNVISHETAHMWFGDMVTMAWFNDVWMKEVFANFVADKVTEKLMGKETFNLKFLQDHYPAAYAVDRTQGANPIRQQLTNLQDAGTSLALSIALKSDTANTVLQQQRSRIKNADRKDRLTFLMPALSPNVATRDTFFNALADRRNRQKEAWVATALVYLNHPLRQNTSVKYLPKSLDLVEEIQRTGDVFFPQSWLAAVFSNYQSKEAYKAVSDFLNSHPNYNPKLKDKILQATDNLYRAQKMLK